MKLKGDRFSILVDRLREEGYHITIQDVLYGRKTSRWTYDLETKRWVRNRLLIRTAIVLGKNSYAEIIDDAQYKVYEKPKERIIAEHNVHRDRVLRYSPWGRPTIDLKLPSTENEMGYLLFYLNLLDSSKIPDAIKPEANGRKRYLWFYPYHLRIQWNRLKIM